MTVKTTVEYTDPLQHIYNPSDVEVSGGRAKLASKVLASEIAFFNFDVDGSSLSKRGGLSILLPSHNVANPSVAIIQNGWLEVKGNDYSFGIINNIPKISDGSNASVRLKVRVNFTTIGQPSDFLSLSNNENSSIVRFYLQNQGGGVTRIRAEIKDNLGITKYNGILGTKVFIIGDIFEVGFSRDNLSGDYYLILNGVKIASFPMTFLMDTINVQMGGPYPQRTNWSYDDLQIWNGIEIPELETGFISQEATTYSKDIDNYIITTAPFLMDKFISFGEQAERFNGTDIKYIFMINTDMQWFNGTEWAISNGSNLEANTVQDIIDNMETFPVSSGVGAYITLQAVLSSTSGYDTPILESNNIEYSFYFQNGGSTICAIYGNIVDNCGEGIEGAKIKIDSIDYIKGNDLVGPSCTTTTNSNGRWSIGLIETATTGKTVTITVSYPKSELVFGVVEFEDIVYSNITIPNQSSISFGDLVNP